MVGSQLGTLDGKIVREDHSNDVKLRTIPRHMKICGISVQQSEIFGIQTVILTLRGRYDIMPEEKIIWDFTAEQQNIASRAPTVSKWINQDKEVIGTILSFKENQKPLIDFVVYKRPVFDF